MASSIRRERQLARERYERQQAKRAEARERKRRWQQITAVVLAVLLVIGGVAGLAALLGEDDDSTVGAEPTASVSPTVSESPSASPSPSASAGGCTYAPSPEEAAKDVGIPTFDEATAEEPFTATLKTNQGDIAIEMAAAEAPCTTNSFRHLSTEGYYDGTSCHRLTVENIFVLQCGDPTGTGGGGPGYQFGIENAPPDGMFPAGTVAMARTSDPNSNGSQFFIVYQDTQLPIEGGGYSIFGTVTEGLDAVEAVADAGVVEGSETPAEAVTITSVEIDEG